MVDQVIKLKRNTTNTNAPGTSDIAVGELAIGAVAGKLYIRKSDDSILEFTDSTASSSAADDISTGDAAVTIATTSGNITIDAQANDSDIIFKGFLRIFGRMETDNGDLNEHFCASHI